MTIVEFFKIAPKSERTLIKHGYRVGGYFLLNDFGHPCEYRVVGVGRTATGIQCIGVIKYLSGRLLSCYGLEPESPANNPMLKEKGS